MFCSAQEVKCSKSIGSNVAYQFNKIDKDEFDTRSHPEGTAQEIWNLDSIQTAWGIHYPNKFILEDIILSDFVGSM